MTKATKFRMLFTLIILVFDFFFITGFIHFLFEIKKDANLIQGYSYSISHSLNVLMSKEMREVWFWLQPAFLAGLVWVWTTGRTNLHQFTENQTPAAAGHGQFGTARWMNEKEMDKVFTVHKF